MAAGSSRGYTVANAPGGRLAHQPGSGECVAPASGQRVQPSRLQVIRWRPWRAADRRLLVVLPESPRVRDVPTPVGVGARGPRSRPTRLMRGAEGGTRPRPPWVRHRQTGPGTATRIRRRLGCASPACLGRRSNARERRKQLRSRDEAAHPRTAHEPSQRVNVAHQRGGPAEPPAGTTRTRPTRLSSGCRSAQQTTKSGIDPRQSSDPLQTSTVTI